MPRKPVGDHALTPAERQAYQRAKQQHQRETMIRALEEVLSARYITDARETAERALRSIGRRPVPETAA